MKERPIVALTVATLTNTILDYKVASDHRSRQATMGLPDGGAVVGDFAIARYIARRAATSSVAANLLPESPAQLAIVDSWVDYAQSLQLFGDAHRIPAVALTLMRVLQHQTYVVGSKMTMADVALFAVFGFPTEADTFADVEKHLPPDSVPVRRWFDMMRNSPALREANMVALAVANNAEAVFDQGGIVPELVSGMNLLEGGVLGRVVTRFPPEPSGYLHIGHSKVCSSCDVSFLFQQRIPFLALTIYQNPLTAQYICLTVDLGCFIERLFRPPVQWPPYCPL